RRLSRCLSWLEHGVVIRLVYLRYRLVDLLLRNGARLFPQGEGGQQSMGTWGDHPRMDLAVAPPVPPVTPAAAGEMRRPAAQAPSFPASGRGKGAGGAAQAGPVVRSAPAGARNKENRKNAALRRVVKISDDRHHCR